MTDKRGLIIHNKVTVDGTSLLMNGVGYDEQDLRIALLFFDELDHPQNTMIGMGDGGSVGDYLVSAGAMRRTNVTVELPMTGDGLFRRLAATTYAWHEEQEPGVWAINTGANSVHAVDSAPILSGRGALVRLFQAIPVPHRDVALADLLEFREKRRPELLAMRAALEDLYQEIEQAPDRPLAWNNKCGSLTRAINAHLDTARESKLAWRWGSVDWRISLSSVAGAALTAMLAGVPWLQALQIGAGAGAPSVSISGAASMKRKSQTPWQYVASIHNDLMIGE